MDVVPPALGGGGAGTKTVRITALPCNPQLHLPTLCSLALPFTHLFPPHFTSSSLTPLQTMSFPVHVLFTNNCARRLLSYWGHTRPVYR